MNSSHRHCRRIVFVLLTGLLAGWISLKNALAADTQLPAPNIVLMMADDLGWGDVGFNGNEVIRTPHLDAMAQAGLKFNRFYAAAPVCSPTRGSVLTGRHPYRYGILFANVGHMPPQELTLAEVLKKQGYTTGHFGKWHLGTLTKTIRDSNRGGPDGAVHYSTPRQNGFDVCFSTEAKVPTWDPMVKPKGAAAGAPWWDPLEHPSQGQAYGTAYWNIDGEKVIEHLEGDDSCLIMDRVVPFIQNSVCIRRPFFAVIWFHAPHLPVVAGPAYTSLYPQCSQYEQHYYGCITAMDQQVGRLRRELRQLGVATNTMVWFCSDNGPEGRAGKAPGSAGPFRGRKRDLFEGGVRVPGLLEWPARIQPGSVTDFPAVTSDYLPTILDLFDLELPDARPIDGISLLPMLDGKMKHRPQPIGFQSAGQFTLIEHQYKLIHVPGQQKGRRRAQTSTAPATYALFDLLADPSEKNDIARHHPERLKRMAATLEDWRRSCRASNAGADY